LLEPSGIDVPRHVFLNRDGYISTGTGGGNGNNDTDVAEYDDHIEVDGVITHKPFVEKPVNADHHNIAINYPTSADGGCKKLFRKIGNRSSEFCADVNEVRRDGSYIYEQFVETQGTDVNMYTLGPEYGHAEACKSPTVDVKVERDSEGNEVRFPAILTLREKEIAHRIVLGFKQCVCGFDLRQVQEGDSLFPYVCDVNGWSFVKNNRCVLSSLVDAKHAIFFSHLPCMYFLRLVNTMTIVHRFSLNYAGSIGANVSALLCDTGPNANIVARSPGRGELDWY
jgi:inositol hexakisphosphate/diphosphoinositol-pentakisphosphate kinase